jgi:cell division protein FtsB
MFMDESRMSQKRRAPRTKLPAGRRRIAHLLLPFVAAIIIVDGLVGEHGLLAILRAYREYDELSTAIARQQVENARLREEVRRLHEDPTAIEEIARRELGLIMPDETVFIIVKDVPPTPAKP